MKTKKDEITIRSGAAEYLPHVASGRRPAGQYWDALWGWEYMAGAVDDGDAVWCKSRRNQSAYKKDLRTIKVDVSENSAEETEEMIGGL